MNPPSDTSTPSPAETPGKRPGMEESSPANWAEALMALIASRIALIQFEARASAKTGVKRVVRIVVAVLCLFFTWILLLGGAIGAIAATTGWPWYWLAIAAAGLHLLLAILLAAAFNKPGAPAFPITRAEFQKDREWIQSIQKKSKSND